jgi:RNA polymerase sigma-70 factor (ECF subfamily)
VLETLTPERLAFPPPRHVRRPFDDRRDRRTQPGRSAPAQRAAPAGNRGAPLNEDAGQHRYELVDAFLAASRAGDFEALVAVLDPTSSSAPTRGPAPPARPPVEGAEPVARRCSNAPTARDLAQPALVNVAPGWSSDGLFNRSPVASDWAAAAAAIDYTDRQKLARVVPRWGRARRMRASGDR